MANTADKFNFHLIGYLQFLSHVIDGVTQTPHFSIILLVNANTQLSSSNPTGSGFHFIQWLHNALDKE